MILEWFAVNQVAGALIALMAGDVLMGMLLAFKDNKLNSSVNRVGMLRKVGIILIVALSFVIQPFAQGIPAGTISATAFLISEFLSVLENGARLGLKIPGRLYDALSKLRGESANPLTVRVIKHPHDSN